MGNYTKFRIEARHNHTSFRVQVKGWFMWRSGYMVTDYFSVHYTTEKSALESIDIKKGSRRSHETN